MPMTGPTPVPRENAIPVLNARLNRSDPITSMLPSCRALTAQCFVSWSTRTTTAAISSAPRSRRSVVHGAAHRRPMPPTFSSTRTVAHGIASRRSRGIGAPDTTE